MILATPRTTSIGATCSSTHQSLKRRWLTIPPSQPPPPPPRHNEQYYRAVVGHSKNASSENHSWRRRHRLIVATILAGGFAYYGVTNQHTGWVLEEEVVDYAKVETELFQTLQKGLHQLNDIVDRIQRGEHVPDEEIDRKVEATLKLIDESHAEIDREIEESEKNDGFYDDDDDDEEFDDVNTVDDELELDEGLDRELTEQMLLIDKLLLELVKEYHDNNENEKINDNDRQQHES